MPVVATITSMTAGTTCVPHFVLAGSENTIAQGLAISRVGDNALPERYHSAKHPHGTAIATGSSSVLVNGIPAAYVGSGMTCGDIIGSSPANTVVIGA